ncbi:hypothetical protein ACMG4P_18120 [Pseudovibrio denitrificans]|uniref:hypothetical protein n=1 Tax=Pseudovibrio denitrificans TaxID=258256 RepID=UPI0039BF8AC4
MRYNIIAAKTFGSLTANQFETTRFLTGGQGSCLVVYVLKGIGQDRTAAMAHILSANLVATNTDKQVSEEKKNGNVIKVTTVTTQVRKSVDAATCQKRLGNFWTDYLAGVDKGNVTFIIGKEPEPSTWMALEAIQQAMKDNPGDFNPEIKSIEPEYAVTAPGGEVVTEGVPSWRNAQRTLLKKTDSADEKDKIIKAMNSGLPGEELILNDNVFSGMTSVEIPPND